MTGNSLLLSDYRCNCGKLLLKGIVFDGIIEIKCKRCGEITKIGEAKIIEDSSRYVLIIDDKGFISNTSDSVFDILGYQREELIGKSITQINASLPKEIGIKFFGPDSLLNKDSSLRLDTIHKSKAGNIIPVTIFLKFFSPTSHEKYIIEYVTLKKDLVEDNITKTNHDQYIENTCDYYFDLDKNGVIEYISQPMEKIFSFAQEKIIGKNYFDFLPLTKILKEKKTFKHFSSLEHSYRVIQDVGLDKKGTIINSDLYFTTKFNEIGKHIGYRVLGWIP